MRGSHAVISGVMVCLLSACGTTGQIAHTSTSDRSSATSSKGSGAIGQGASSGTLSTPESALSRSTSKNTTKSAGFSTSSSSSPSLASSYTPPAVVNPVALSGSWVAGSLHAPSSWGTPLGIDLPSGAETLKEPMGASLDIPVEIAANRSLQVSLLHNVVLRVQITTNFPPESGSAKARVAPVWAATLPALGGSITGNEVFHVVWNQRDASHKQVPPGAYILSVEAPLPSVSYKLGIAGSVRKEQLGFGTSLSGDHSWQDLTVG